MGMLIDQRGVLGRGWLFRRMVMEPGGGVRAELRVGVDRAEADGDFGLAGSVAEGVGEELCGAHGHVLAGFDALNPAIGDAPVLQAVGPEVSADPDAVGVVSKVNEV